MFLSLLQNLSIFCTFSFARAVIHACVSGSTCVFVCVCVGQTPVLHPLLHLLSQLHTGRERGLSMHVCTTHVSYPFNPSLSLFFLLLYKNNLTALIGKTKTVKNQAVCFSECTLHVISAPN